VFSVEFQVDITMFSGGLPNKRGNPNEISKSRYLIGQEKMKNKANFNLGKIGVSYYLTSEYEDFWAFCEF
jgi:hypothetical protein